MIRRQDVAERVLTDRTLKALDAGKRYIVWDIIVPGLGVRVTDKGRRTFIVMRLRPGDRNPVRYAIGDCAAVTLKQARDLARTALNELASGMHPTERRAQARREEALRRRDTFEAVAEDFINRHVSKLRSGPAVTSTIYRYLIPRWGSRPITTITRRDIVELLEKTVDTGAPYIAHHLLAYTRKLFNWAIAREMYGLQISPCDRISPREVIGTKEPRQRIID